MKTFSAKPEEIEKAWYVLDASGQSIGRLAVDAARILRGKHKPEFTPHVDAGDFVIVINAAQVQLTGGSKGAEKVYRHSGWPGGIKWVTRAQELERKPQEAVRRVVRGMLPHNKLGDALIGKLKVYAGPDHPHEAQKPVAWVGASAE